MQDRLTPTSDAQADPELLQSQASVSVPVTVLGELLGTPSGLQPPPQELTERSSLALAQHPARVHVQLAEVPLQHRLWSGGLLRIQCRRRRSDIQNHGGGGAGCGGGRADSCRAGGRCV